MDIRDRIRSIIDANPDFSVRNVSLAAGLSDSFLDKFLKGKVESPTLATVAKLAKALNVDERWLVYGEGSPERASDISHIYEGLGARDRERVRQILESFARTGTDD